MIKFENKENGRYYYLHVSNDLFDRNVLVVIRGGRNQHQSPKPILSGDMGIILERIAIITKRRLSRGYTIAN